MSKVCSICKKGPSTGNTRSHSNIGSKRIFNANLFTRKSNPFTGKKEKTKLCAKCLKTSTKVAA